MATKQKILIVDDDNNIAELVALYLTKECFETKIVNDGEEALKIFPEFKPNLILLDLMLPGIDGYQVCREIRSKASTPIIMLSDRQTTGGYAKIGTVCSVDLPKLVQCTPGRIIRFAPVTIQQAQDLYRQEARRMEALAKMVRRPCYGGISPRRTARRLTPILEAQARAHASGSQKLWIELSKTEQQRLQPAEQPASDPNR